MIIVAGPPGSGKSSLYPVSSFGVAYFNADDRAAELNGGSYTGITKQVRQQVNREFETFVMCQIEFKESFAVETTLRSNVSFEQAQYAKNRGFTTEMRYLALQSFGLHLERVKARADAGGHSASEATLRRIYESSLRNLGRAIREMDELWVYGNTRLDAEHPLVLEAHEGRILYAAEPLPDWLHTALWNVL